MNDERSMILKMLQEGKLSVEEADALLDVLKDAEPRGEGAAFTGRKAAEPPPHEPPPHDQQPHDRPGAEPPSGERPPRPEEGERVRFEQRFESDRGKRREHAGRGFEGGHGDRSDRDRGRRPGAFGFDLDLDLSDLKEGLRETIGSVRDGVRGVSETLKEAFSSFADADFAGAFVHAMGRARAEEERTLSEPAAGARSLSIHNRWGDVRVTGADTDEITVVAHVSAWADDEPLARSVLEGTRVRLVRTGEEWDLSSEPGSQRGLRIDYQVKLPAAIDVSISAASGDLWLEGLSGSQRVNTFSGDVNVASLGSCAAGTQSFSTKSGDVVAACLCGEITLSTLSGDVRVDEFTGFLTVNTKSGDIRVRDGHGSVQLQSISGDVEADLLEIGGEPIKLGSVSGEVSLKVPPEASLRIDARSVSGGVSVGLDLEDASRSRRRITGSANGGRLDATLSSVSGDVEVEGR